MMIGCTTAGEIGPCGYQENSLVGFSLASEQLKVLLYCIKELRQHGAPQTESIRESFGKELSKARKSDPSTQAFGLLLVEQRPYFGLHGSRSGRREKPLLR